MNEIARGAAARHSSRRPDATVPAATDGLLALLRRLPARLTDLSDPTDREALALASRRNAVRLLLSGGTAFVVRSRRP